MRRRKRRKRRRREREKKRGPVRERSAKEAVHVAEIPAKHRTDELAGLVSIRGPGVGKGREAGVESIREAAVTIGQKGNNTDHAAETSEGQRARNASLTNTGVGAENASAYPRRK